MKPRNIYKNLPKPASKEIFSTLARAGNIKIERIVSRGQKSPPGFWYDQDYDEFCILLRGAAKLQIAGERRLRRLKAGDYLLLPAHKRHRVEWTRPKTNTIWLAVRGQKISSSICSPARG